MEIIKVTNLNFGYQEETLVLKNINLTFQAGKHYVILGHNGSGKSTLAKLLAGLLFSKENNIYINNQQLNAKTAPFLRQQIGIVFQNPDNQFIGSTVADDIAFGLENRQVPRSDMIKIIASVAQAVGMADYLEKEPAQLSGGQKQRVAIAGVIALKPQILILDEATSMLDPKGRGEFNHILSKMKQEQPDLTIISITHDEEETLNADYVIILDSGEVVCCGNSKEIMNNTDLESLHLEYPFIIKLKKELQKNNIAIDGDNIAELLEKLWQ